MKSDRVGIAPTRPVVEQLHIVARKAPARPSRSRSCAALHVRVWQQVLARAAGVVGSPAFWRPREQASELQLHSSQVGSGRKERGGLRAAGAAARA